MPYHPWWALLGTIALLLPGQPVVAGEKPALLHSIEWQDVEQGFPAHIYQSGISQDGKLFFGAGDAGPTGTIRVFELRTGKQLQEFRPGDNVWYSNAAFVPGGKYLAASYRDSKDLFLWDLTSGKLVHRFTGHAELGIGFALSSDGKRLLSWSNDKTVRLWDLETGKELYKLDGHMDRANGVFSPDAKKILTCGADKTLRLWDAATGKELQKIDSESDSCNAIPSPDGLKVFLTSADQPTRLCDLKTGKKIRLFGGAAKDGARGFVAEGKQVAAYCEDKRFRVWETTNGRLVREIDLSKEPAIHGDLAASPDGRLALLPYQDGTVRALDLATGKEIHRYDGGRASRGISFSPDGNFAAAGSFRAGMYVFRLPEKAARP